MNIGNPQYQNNLHILMELQISHQYISINSVKWNCCSLQLIKFIIMLIESMVSAVELDVSP